MIESESEIEDDDVDPLLISRLQDALGNAAVKGDGEESDSDVSVVCYRRWDTGVET